MPLWRSADERKAAAATKTEVESLLSRLDTNDTATVREVTVALHERVRSDALSKREQVQMIERWRVARDQVFRRHTEALLADDYLTVQEELAFDEFMNAFEIDGNALATGWRDLFFRLLIAQANDGRLPVLTQPQLMCKGDEVVHGEWVASLMKEVTIREYRGGYSGVSFRIAKGVRYHTGGSRGRAVVVGTELQVADTGVLSVSSKRAAFLGNRKSMEFPYAKLMSIDVFTDGIRFHSSNRQTTPLFQLESGDVVAATLNAGIQRFEDQPTPRGRRTRSASDTSD